MAGQSADDAADAEVSFVDEVVQEIASDDLAPFSTIGARQLTNDIEFLAPYIAPVLMRRLADEMQEKKVAHQSVIDWVRAKVVRTTQERRTR